MYPEVDEFALLMKEELFNNRHKGDQLMWRKMTPRDILGEILYHAGKLAVAYHDENHPKIREHLVDIANICMMGADNHGGILEGVCNYN